MTGETGHSSPLPLTGTKPGLTKNARSVLRGVIELAKGLQSEPSLSGEKRSAFFFDDLYHVRDLAGSCREGMVCLPVSRYKVHFVKGPKTNQRKRAGRRGGG